jgi:hypothetical protein
MNKKTETVFDADGGKHVVIDTSKDATWGDVKAVESHYGKDGLLLSFTNHREIGYEEVVRRIISVTSPK